MNRYSTEFFAFCPANGVRVKYELTIRTDRMIEVEEIVNKVTLHHRGYHEDIADQLYECFGGLQVLHAYHHGVTIKTIRPRRSK